MRFATERVVEGMKKEKDSLARPEKELIRLNIHNINEGALIQLFDIELEKALNNVADLNTPATAARVITLQLVLKPSSDRVVIETEVKGDSKLAPVETHKSKIFLGQIQIVDEETGEISYGVGAFDADPRQMSLWAAPRAPATPKPIEFNRGS